MMKLWVEDYRPSKVSDLIVPVGLMRTLMGIVKSGVVPNSIFYGLQGTGKTTAAKAICNQLGLDSIVINGSDESGIDVLRTKIRSFASTMSLSGGMKVVILDEADYLNSNSTQPALRNFIEEYSDNCRFIMTANFKDRIIAPLHSRCTTIDFTPRKKDLAALAKRFMAALKKILDTEGVRYEDRILAELILKYLPDWRRVINECQRYSTAGDGTIDEGILSALPRDQLNSLVGFLKNKKFGEMRRWVVENVSNVESVRFYRSIYDAAYDVFTPEFIPEAILIVAEYAYKDSMVTDKEINVVAFLTELMGRGKYR